MQLTRRTPFHAMTALERQLQTMLDQFSGRSRLGDFTWKPTTDVYTEDDTLFIRCELPGIEPSNLTVELEGSVLRIAGEKHEEHEVEEANRYVRERRFGSFQRDIVVPDGVDVEHIDARYAKGILTVSLPIEKAEPEEPTKISIDITQEQPVS